MSQYIQLFTAALSQPLVNIDQALNEKDEIIAGLQHSLSQLEQLNAELNARVQHPLKTQDVEQEYQLVDDVTEPGVDVHVISMPYITPFDESPLPTSPPPNKPSRPQFKRSAIVASPSISIMSMPHITPFDESLLSTSPPSHKPQFKRSAIVANPIILPNSYTKSEACLMTDAQIVSEFKRITGLTELRCKHCGQRKQGGKAKPIEPFWINEIVIRCKNKGINIDEIPKTCDKRQSKNRKTNPSSNATYPGMREAAKSNNHETVRQLSALRCAAVEELGMNPSPWRYV